jgi:enamine deaminase RidA (YjgF/YER057c/UK114 family)
MAELEHIRPADLSNHPAYTHVVAARGARHVYVSGQVAVDADGTPVGAGDLAAQTEQVMQNLGTALAAAGATFDDVVKITTFVVDYTPEMRSTIGEVRGRYLPADNPPASTLVGVSALAAPDWLIEIEAIAVTD